MKGCTLVASLLNEEDGELWLAEILEVEGCTTRGKDLQAVIQRATELREAIVTINEFQFLEEKESKDGQTTSSANDVVGFFISHKKKANGSICSDIGEVLGIIEKFDILEDRGNKAFRRHLGIMLTHLSPVTPTLIIGPWTIQSKSMKSELGKAPEWEGWRDKAKDNKESA